MEIQEPEQHRQLNFIQSCILQEDRNWIEDVLFLGERNQFASSSSKNVKIWCLKQKKQIGELKTNIDQSNKIINLNKMKYYPNIKFKGRTFDALAVCSTQGFYFLFDIDRYQLLLKIKCHAPYDSDMFYKNKQQLIITSSHLGMLQVFNFQGKQLYQFKKSFFNNALNSNSSSNPAWAIIISEISQQVLVGVGKQLCFINILKCQILKQIEINTTIFSLKQISNKNIIIGGDYTFLIFIDPQQQTVFLQGKGHSNQVRGVCFLEDKKIAFSASCDSSIKLWNCSHLIDKNTEQLNEIQSNQIQPFQEFKDNLPFLNSIDSYKNYVVVTGWNEYIYVYEID